MSKHTPESLLNLLVDCHNIINFMESHLEDHLAASTAALPNPPKDLKKDLEDWVHFVSDGIEIKKEKELQDSEELNLG